MQRHQMMTTRMLVQNLLKPLDNPFHRKFVIWIIIVFYSQLYNNISNSKCLVNNLVLLLLLFSVVGGSLILFDYDDIFAQSTDFQLPSLSFSTPYSDMPSNMQGSLSELGDIDDEVDSQVKEIIKPTFQNPLEKSVTKENDDISSVIDSKGSGIG